MASPPFQLQKTQLAILKHPLLPFILRTLSDTRAGVDLQAENRPCPNEKAARSLPDSLENPELTDFLCLCLETLRIERQRSRFHFDQALQYCEAVVSLLESSVPIIQHPEALAASPPSTDPIARLKASTAHLRGSSFGITPNHLALQRKMGLERELHPALKRKSPTALAEDGDSNIDEPEHTQRPPASYEDDDDDADANHSGRRGKKSEEGRREKKKKSNYKKRKVPRPGRVGPRLPEEIANKVSEIASTREDLLNSTSSTMISASLSQSIANLKRPVQGTSPIFSNHQFSSNPGASLLSAVSASPLVHANRQAYGHAAEYFPNYLEDRKYAMHNPTTIQSPSSMQSLHPHHHHMINSPQLQYQMQYTHLQQHPVYHMSVPASSLPLEQSHSAPP